MTEGEALLLSGVVSLMITFALKLIWDSLEPPNEDD